VFGYTADDFITAVRNMVVLHDCARIAVGYAHDLLRTYLYPACGEGAAVFTLNSTESRLQSLRFAEPVIVSKLSRDEAGFGVPTPETRQTGQGGRLLRAVSGGARADSAGQAVAQGAAQGAAARASSAPRSVANPDTLQSAFLEAKAVLTYDLFERVHAAALYLNQPLTLALRELRRASQDERLAAVVSGSPPGSPPSSPRPKGAPGASNPSSPLTSLKSLSLFAADSMLQYFNPFHLNARREILCEWFEKSGDETTNVSSCVSYIAPGVTQLGSQQIFRSSGEVFALLRWIVMFGLASPACLAFFQNQANSGAAMSMLTEYMLYAARHNLPFPADSTYLAQQMPQDSHERQNSTQNSTQTGSTDASAASQILSSRNLRIAVVAVPSSSVAACLLNNTSNGTLAYNATLRFRASIYAHKYNTVIVYLVFLVNSLHQDMSVSDLLLSVAFQNRIFGLYTLIHLSTIFSAKLQPQERALIARALRLDDVLSLPTDDYLDPAPRPKGAQGRTFSTCEELLTSEKASPELLARADESIDRLYSFMRLQDQLESVDVPASIADLVQAFAKAPHVLRAYVLYIRILSHSPDASRTFFIENLGFYAKMTRVSGELLADPPAAREKRLHEKLRAFNADFRPGSDIVLLSNPNVKIQSIIYKNAKVLKSHAKVPYLVTFKLKPMIDTGRGLNGTATEDGGIFKAGDDVSQDQVVLILTSLFRQLFQPLRLWLSPYIAFPIGGNDGFIEILRDSKSLDQIGSMSDSFLTGYFEKVSGPGGKLSKQEATRRFLLSTTGYSLVSYILNFKDRHNGNIMLNSSCNIIHIDFGYAFDIAPGGAFNSERADFKLTKEYIRIMGGEGSPSYNLFRCLYARGLLLARLLGKDLTFLVEALLSAGLDAITGKGTVRSLRQRMKIDTSFPEVVSFAMAQIKECEKRGYGAYDRFQAMQNDIAF